MKTKVLIFTLLGGAGVFLSGAGITATGEQYSLTVIEDEQTALAAGVSQGSSLYYFTAGLLILVMVLTAIGIYFMECIKYRKRIISLAEKIGQDELKVSWNLMHLKETVQNMESRFIED